MTSSFTKLPSATSGKIDWRFTPGDALIKLKRLHPSNNVIGRSPSEVFGYLQASSRSATQPDKYTEAASVETVRLPDGTKATLRQMRPIANKASKNQYWEGKFDRNNVTYTLTIVSSEIPKDAIKQALSTMVLMPEANTSGKEHTTPKARRHAQSAGENSSPLPSQGGSRA